MNAGRCSVLLYLSEAVNVISLPSRRSRRPSAGSLEVRGGELWVKHREQVPGLGVDPAAQSGASPLHPLRPTAFNQPLHGCAPPWEERGSADGKTTRMQGFKFEKSNFR